MTYDKNQLAGLIDQAIGPDPTDPGAHDRLVDFLQHLDFYKEHKQPALRLAGSMTDVRPAALAGHLVRLARERNTQQALLGLDELLALDSNEVMTIAYIDNVEATRRIEMGGGVIAFPDDQAPHPAIQEVITRYRNPMIVRRGAVLIVRENQKPFARLPEGMDFPQALAKVSLPRPGVEAIETALRMITLDGPSAPILRFSSSVMTSTTPSLFAPPGGVQFHATGGFAPSMPHPLTEKPAQILQQYRRLSEADRRKVDGAISRLNRAVMSAEISDKIVEAAISIEALLGDANTELKYRIRVRSALLLETGFDERKEIKRVVGSLYDERSSIVHTGFGKAGDAELARRGIEIASRLIERLIQLERIPDWDEVELTDGRIPTGSVSGVES